MTSEQEAVPPWNYVAFLLRDCHLVSGIGGGAYGSHWGYSGLWCRICERVHVSLEVRNLHERTKGEAT